MSQFDGMNAPEMMFKGRAAIQQRVLPNYRAAFMEALATACEKGLGVFAGKPVSNEQIIPVEELKLARTFRAFNLHLANPRSPLFLCWQRGLLTWLKSWKPDVLVVEANPRYLSTPPAVRWMHQNGKSVLGWGLGAPQEMGLFGRWRERWRREFLLSLDGIIAYSQRGAQEYITVGFPPDRVFIAPNAVSPRPPHPLPERPGYFAGGMARILFVGRLQGRKRVDNLLRACAALPEKLRPLVTVVGDGPAREEFESLADKIYPLAEFPGARYGDELEDYLLNADLFVLPGTGGLAVQQAMAYGLPVIVAQGDGTQGDLVRPENGWLIPNDDWKALHNALKEALQDVSRLRLMGEASYRIVAQEINIERMVAVFVQAMTQVKVR